MEMRSKLVLTGTVLATVMGAPIVVSANSKIEMKVVRTSSLNIRSIQDQNEVIERIKEGTIVEVIKEMEKQPGWYYVQTPSGKKGVCSGAYLSKVSNTSNQSDSLVYYTSERLNVRTGPGTGYSVIKTVAKGTKVEKISESNGWAKVKLDNNKIGYCSAGYLQKTKVQSNATSGNQSTTKTCYVNTDFLNVRTGPGTSYGICTKVYKDNSVLVIEKRSDGWSKIDIGGKYYYVSSRYLTETKPSSSSLSTTKTMHVNYDYLNVRTGPSVSYKLYKTINKGTEVKVAEKRSDGWSKISMDGKYYYVSSKYLSESKPSNTSYSYICGKASIPTKNISKNSLINVKNALSKIDGKVIAPGGEFDYLKSIGARTISNGYVSSTIILGGSYATDIGGGICAGSTAIHNAVVESGLKVTERRNHSLPSAYVKKGMDAMVSGSLTYRFKNTSEYPVRIQTSVSSKYITVTLESTGDIKNGYTYEPETVVSSDGLRATATVWKMKNGKKVEVHQKFNSTYRKA